jgi:hypothetical protein
MAGCSNDGAGGPVISSLSTPTDSAAGLDLDLASTSADSDSGGEEDPIITMTSTPEGVTARLTWDHPSDINVASYYIYYGKRSPEQPGSGGSVSEEPVSEATVSEEQISEAPSSCSQGESLAVDVPAATITGLEPNTPYFFAIRAVNKNESESLCSNEIIAVTPPAHT